MTSAENENNENSKNSKNIDMIIRENPDCKIPCLRFIVGGYRRKQEQKPVYDGPGWKARVTHHEDSNTVGEVFHVLGFGDTLLKAKAMVP